MSALDLGLGPEGVVDVEDEDAAGWAGLRYKDCIAAADAELEGGQNRRLQGNKLMGNIRHSGVEVDSEDVVFGEGMIEGEFPLGWRIAKCRVPVGYHTWIVGDEFRAPKMQRVDGQKEFDYEDQ